MSRDYSVVGTRPIRVDGAEKVMGSAQFGADVRLPGTLVGRMLRSPYAHARIVSIDTSRAQALAGVLAVVTNADFPTLRPGGVGDVAADNLAWDKVLFHGHGLAAVAATSSAIAQRALELIDVTFEVLPPVMSLDAALADDVILHDHITDEDGNPTNTYTRDVQSIGDVARGFDEADVVVEREFETPTVHQGYIEPPACLANWVEGGQATIWTTTQGHFPVRDSVTTMLGLSASDLRVIPTEIGGGFGGKTAVYLEAIALVLSRKSGRPVRMAMTREEVFRVAGPGAASRSRVRIGARRDGTITAMQAWMAYESGAFPAAPVGGGMRCVFSAYDVANVHIEGLAVLVNKPKVRAYRGPGAPQATFAAESALSELAEMLEMDPIEFRLKNALRDNGTNVIGPVREIGLVPCLEAATAGGSRTINATGQAVVRATREVIAEMKSRAAAGWNITPDKVEWREGQAVDTTHDEAMTAKESAVAPRRPAAPSPPLRR